MGYKEDQNLDAESFIQIGKNLNKTSGFLKVTGRPRQETDQDFKKYCCGAFCVAVG